MKEEEWRLKNRASGKNKKKKRILLMKKKKEPLLKDKRHMERKNSKIAKLKMKKSSFLLFLLNFFPVKKANCKLLLNALFSILFTTQKQKNLQFLNTLIQFN